MSGRELRNLGLTSGEWLGDVKPLALPLFDGLYEGALKLAHLLDLGLMPKIFSHNAKCGSMRRKASQMVMKEVR